MDKSGEPYLLVGTDRSPEDICLQYLILSSVLSQH